MGRVPGESSAADRARWLAELADAVAQAQKLCWELGASSAVALELYGQLEVIGQEVQALRLGRLQAASEELDPDWLNSLGWPSHGKDA